MKRKKLAEKQRQMRERERGKQRTGRPSKQPLCLHATLETKASWTRMARMKVRAYCALRLGKSVESVARQLSREASAQYTVEKVTAWVRLGCPLMSVKEVESGLKAIIREETRQLRG